MQQQPEYIEYSTEKINFFAEKIINYQTRHFSDIAKEIAINPDSFSWYNEFLDYIDSLETINDPQLNQTFLNIYNEKIKSFGENHPLAKQVIEYSMKPKEHEYDNEFINIISQMTKPILYAFGHIALNTSWNERISDLLETYMQMPDEKLAAYAKSKESPAGLVSYLISEYIEFKIGNDDTINNLFDRHIEVIRQKSMGDESKKQFMVQGVRTAQEATDTLLLILTMISPEASAEELLNKAGDPGFMHNEVIMATQKKEFIARFTKPFKAGEGANLFPEKRARVFKDTLDKDTLKLDVDKTNSVMDQYKPLTHKSFDSLQYCIAIPGVFKDPLNPGKSASLITIYYNLMMFFAKKKIWKKSDGTLGNYFEVLKQKYGSIATV